MNVSFFTNKDGKAYFMQLAYQADDVSNAKTVNALGAVLLAIRRDICGMNTKLNPETCWKAASIHPSA